MVVLASIIEITERKRAEEKRDELLRALVKRIVELARGRAKRPGPQRGGDHGYLRAQRAAERSDRAVGPRRALPDGARGEFPSLS